MLNVDLTTKGFENLADRTAVELRQLAGKLGIKGAAKGRKADLIAAIEPLRAEAVAERDRQEAAKAEAAEPKRGTCTECGRKEDFRASGLCEPCRTYGEWENTHADENHADQQVVEECPVCRPELDPRKPVAKREGRSRAGMVIVAKGSEMHKSLLFKESAEAVGWTVEIERETYELPDDATGEGTRYYATATRGNDSISLAWNGRAYDYPASSAVINGKDRKIRNLKEALRVLAI